MPESESLPPRTVRESQSEYSEIALPNDANPFGNLLGGRVMHLVDLVAATSAMRHARRAVSTAAVDSMTFQHPIRIGQLIILKASVNRVFRTSMEIGVKVWAEDLMTGERWHTSSAYLTFVALGPDGRPVPIPQVIPETAEERHRHEAAALRRQNRLDMREKLLRKPATP
jgi:acyl-CoA hydrolase